MKDILGYEIWVNIFSTTAFYEELNNLSAKGRIAVICHIFS